MQHLIDKLGGEISTHAPRTGSDSTALSPHSAFIYFNPRSPHGERRCSGKISATCGANFNPRSPHGERLLEVRPCGKF